MWSDLWGACSRQLRPRLFSARKRRKEARRARRTTMTVRRFSCCCNFWSFNSGFETSHCFIVHSKAFKMNSHVVSYEVLQHSWATSHRSDLQVRTANIKEHYEMFRGVDTIKVFALTCLHPLGVKATSVFQALSPEWRGVIILVQSQIFLFLFFLNESQLNAIRINNKTADGAAVSHCQGWFFFWDCLLKHA